MRIVLIASLLFLPLFYSQAQNITKEEAKAYRVKGYELQSIGDIQGALMHYQKAIQTDSHFVQAYNDLGVIYESFGDLGAAKVMYKKVLELDPDFLPAYTNMAFICEKENDIKKATYYWKKRYELGSHGDYWREVSRQHLLKLGTYPQIRKEILENKAAELSKKLVIKREQEEIELIRGAKQHFDRGNHAFLKGDYSTATKEFKEVISLNSPCKELQEDAKDILAKTEQFQLRDEALTSTEHALDYIKSSDYLSAGEKLKKALSTVFRIAQKNKD